MASTQAVGKSSLLKKGSILSETSYFVVQSVDKNNITAKDDYGNVVTIGNKYVDQVLVSADIYSTEVNKTATELAEIFISNPRIAMSVCFTKKDTDKTKKAYDTEVRAAVDKVKNAKVAQVEGLLLDLIQNPISRVIPGEERIMKGRHYGVMNDLGRIEFKDMEDTSAVIKQVDPRTIKWIILNDVKYSLKK